MDKDETIKRVKEVEYNFMKTCHDLYFISVWLLFWALDSY